MQKNIRYLDGLDMAEIKPLDYYDDYFKAPPPLYDVPVEAQSLAYSSESVRRIGSLARFLMHRHERLLLSGLTKFADGRLALAAREMDAAANVIPWLPDLRVIGALAHFQSGRPELGLKSILPAFDVRGAQPMGRYIKAWLPSLRVLVRLDYDLVMAFYPNRLGMMMAAAAAYIETGDFVEAGRLIDRAANEYYLIDEMLYMIVLIHIRMGNYADAWRLLSNRTYKNTDSLDIGLTMLRAEAMLAEHGIERAISEYRAALLFTQKRNPILINRARWRLTGIYREGGYILDEADTLRKIEREFLPAHIQKACAERIAKLPAPEEGDGEDYGVESRIDPNYHRRFDYIWRGRKNKDQQTDFLEV